MSLKPLVSMREALEAPKLLGGALPGESWFAHRTLLIAGMGETLTDEERAIFVEVTGRETEPGQMVEELWEILGRRAGKTRAAGALAAYIGGLCDHSGYLAPGERALLPILASSTTQAERAFMHTLGILEHSPDLRQAIEGKTADTIRLDTMVDVAIRPANFKTIRGITAPAIIADEIAFWMIEGTSNPDGEILNAARPALATTGGPLMVISTPYAKRGELYATFRRDYGPDGDPLVLVARAPSRKFNPTLKQSTIDRAYERDAAAAAAEYGGEFRSDVESFVDRDVVQGCVTSGVSERPPAAGLRYRAFVDPSGGGADGFTLAIGHAEANRAVLDALRERKRASPEAVVEEYAALLKSYGLSEVTGDRYAGEWPREAFRRHGIDYRLSEDTKSGLYQAFLPVLNSGRVDLLDLPALVSQIANLERRVARGGRESIDHPPHGHDDLANAAAGLSSLCVLRAVHPIDAADLVGRYGPGSPWFAKPHPLTSRYGHAA